MEKLRASFKKIRVPQGGDKVYKDECIVCFDTPESETGIYICLNTFLGIGRTNVEEYSRKTENKVFLHIHHIKTELPPEKEVEPEKKIAKLAIGVEGGFNLDAGKKKYKVEEKYKIVLLPEFEELEYPNEELPELIQQSVLGILKAESALHLAEVEAAALAWDGEVRQQTKHADNLLQLDNGVKIPPSGWKCSRCEKTGNLWLNLTDGTILCGRRQLDGSGGNNHAVEYYQQTKYPLAVKLGTITPEGKGDVYSYDEDDMVTDKNLVTHLAKFGINVSLMEKTEKTMLELEIDFNQRAWEWSRLTESGGKMVSAFGPGFTGLRNLGNSCYLNSVMQVLATVPSFVSRFHSEKEELLKRIQYEAAPLDFNVQMAKLIHGLVSGIYSKPESPPITPSPPGSDPEPLCQAGLAPVMFRTLVGKGHNEFSTKKQQDAMEFLDHVLKLTQRNTGQGVDAGHCFKFKVEDKFICTSSEKVRYVARSDMYLPLPVPMEEATNKQEVHAYNERKEEARRNNIPFKSEDEVHARIPFSACLSKLTSAEEIRAFSSAVNAEVNMHKVTRLTTFPDYLFVQLVKFALSPSWEPVKLDVSVDMPDVLDLSSLKGFGLQPEEEEMPDATEEAVAANAQQQVAADPEVNEDVVRQLVEMGFPPAACRKAVHYTGNWGTEAAMNWIMEHMDDADFQDPMPPTSGADESSSPPVFEANPVAISVISSMGFTDDQARLALKHTDNNLERAADWIFSHQTQLDALLAAEKGGAGEGNIVESTPETPVTDGVPKYEMCAFISHMGTSIFVGHYVCHIKRGDKWYVFNDEKVFESENTPKDLGYIYLYRRVDQ